VSHDIRLAESAASVEVIRSLWREYWNALALPPGFQGFARELEGLPGLYAPPAGRLLLATTGGEPAGTIALRPMGAQSCEAKRLYVRPAFRGRGIASILLRRVVQEAHSIGYQDLYGDTLSSMEQALQMYERYGFERVEPYTDHPTPNAIYLRLRLSRAPLTSADLYNRG
jgi:putative acetyltransferase